MTNHQKHAKEAMRDLKKMNDDGLPYDCIIENILLDHGYSQAWTLGKLEILEKSKNAKLEYIKKVGVKQ